MKRMKQITTDSIRGHPSYPYNPRSITSALVLSLALFFCVAVHVFNNFLNAFLRV